MDTGLEPDQCFYIANQAQMRGKRRINLAIDPPPDLAIEVDVTSKTQLDAYAALGVVELWCYENGQLRIYSLQSGQYQRLDQSPTFPQVPVADLVTTALQQSALLGRSPALRVCRQEIRQLLPPIHP